MRTPRHYVSMALQPGATVELPEKSAHYLGRVLRLKDGASLILFNGSGDDYPATLGAMSAKSAVASISARRQGLAESPLHLTLVQGLCRGQRMDFCVQKATELGVVRIVAVAMDRSVVRLSDARVQKRIEHWRAVAISACEQCGRSTIPAIEWAASVGDVIGAGQAESVAMLDASGRNCEEWHLTGSRLALVVGPEGGYSDAERDELLSAGASRWRMGPRTLRTETAGMVALTLAQNRWGDLG